MDSPLRRTAAIAFLAFVTAVPFAFAAGPHKAATPKAELRLATRTLPATLVVPDLEGQPYVFAEGALEDAGFSWYVPGRNGFSANRVVAQSPAPGTHLVDTGAPLVTLTLARNRVYKELGKSQNKSPYHGTAVRRATS
jgi:beta-lactam-binding protein with PASTA domain